MNLSESKRAVDQQVCGSLSSSTPWSMVNVLTSRLADTAFRQQRLKAWQPILTPKTVLPLFLVIGVIFAPIGGLLFVTSNKVQEISIDYSDCVRDAPQCPELGRIPTDKVSSHFKNSTSRGEEPSWCRNTTEVSYGTEDNVQVTAPTCHLQFYNPDRLHAPVLLYYRLTNFYQNHRRYVKSFDQDQLKGAFRSNATIKGSDCDPLQTDPETGKAYYPCGLIANSMFNDTFHPPILLSTSGSSMSNVTYNMTRQGIAWQSDSNLYGETAYKLTDVVPPRNWRKRYPTYNESFPFPDLKTWEEFQVWMRTAGLPTFSKLALRNDQEIMEIGRYEIAIYDCGSSLFIQ